MLQDRESQTFFRGAPKSKIKVACWPADFFSNFRTSEIFYEAVLSEEIYGENTHKNMTLNRRIVNFNQDVNFRIQDVRPGEMAVQ